MKFAETIQDIPNAFRPGPLKIEELGQFYYDKTMSVRTGDAYISPIEDIYEACKVPSEQNTFLLLGHKGCGKSTELNDMAARLAEDGYEIHMVQCGADLDLNNPLYADLLILMGEALVTIADRTGCRPDEDTIETVKNFWQEETEEVGTLTDGSSMEMESGVSSETPGTLTKLLHLFAGIKSDLRYSEENRICYRNRIAKRSSEWIFAMEKIADAITDTLDGRQPILIFEDLDKLNPQDAWDVFYRHAATLAGVSFPVIYTFPIALSYRPDFAALEGYFTWKTLPMIKQEYSDGTPCEAGYETIRKIVFMRAASSLFEEEALTLLIQKTGGSLRDLFAVLNASAQRANRRRSGKVEQEDVRKALEQLKTSLTRRIERKHYPFLAEIYKGNRERIEDQRMLLEMLQANTVLEYNGKRWHNVHPLVADFLKEQDLIDHD